MYYSDDMVCIVCGSSLYMDELPNCSVQCVVTSPPYWSLRKYDGEQDSGGFVFGLEPTPELYVEHTILFLREIRRVLKDDGVVFWNVGGEWHPIKGLTGELRGDGIVTRREVMKYVSH